MVTTGIIAEYNPFHNGHLYHIQKARELTNANAVVVVMSGSFVQRGEPALYNKWARATAALLNGADLVLELPFVFAAQSAEYFASGAVSVLNSLGLVDFLCFGSESADLVMLSRSADILLDEDFLLSQNIKTALSTGISYAAALRTGAGSTALINPNDILGIEYIKALKKQKSGIVPITVKRHKSGYNDASPTDEHIASATAIRKIIASGKLKNSSSFLPSSALNIYYQEHLSGRGPVFYSALDSIITAILRLKGAEGLKDIAYVAEGLENRLYKAAQCSATIEAILKEVKTKRYPLTRLQRVLINAAMGFTAQDLDYYTKGGAGYIRVLGANSIGRSLLGRCRKSVQLPVITKVADYKKHSYYAKQMLEYELKATDLYALCQPHLSTRAGKQDFYTSPIMV